MNDFDKNEYRKELAGRGIDIADVLEAVSLEEIVKELRKRQEQDDQSVTVDNMTQYNTNYTINFTAYDTEPYTIIWMRDVFDE